MCVSSADTVCRDNTVGSRAGLRANDVLEPGELDFENLPIKKEDGRQRLVPGGGRNPAVNGKVSQEAFDFETGHLPWMPLVMMQEALQLPD